MAKKSKRRSQGQGRPAAPRTANSPAAAVISRPTPAAQTTAQRTANLAEEYRYVLGDLKRIGILAAIMFALLVVLAMAAQYLFQ